MFCGDAGIRTLVQTKQQSAFYMLSFCSDFRNRTGTKTNDVLILSPRISVCGRSPSLPYSESLLKCGKPVYIGSQPSGIKGIIILDYAANAKLLSPIIVRLSFFNGVNNLAPTCLQTGDLSCRFQSSPKFYL